MQKGFDWMCVPNILTFYEELSTDQNDIHNYTDDNNIKSTQITI